MHSVNQKASRQSLASALVLCSKGHGLASITDWVETSEMYLPFHTCACRHCYQVLILTALRKAALRDPVTLQGFGEATRLSVGTGCHASSRTCPLCEYACPELLSVRHTPLTPAPPCASRCFACCCFPGETASAKCCPSAGQFSAAHPICCATGLRGLPIAHDSVPAFRTCFSQMEGIQCSLRHIDVDKQQPCPFMTPCT